MDKIHMHSEKKIQWKWKKNKLCILKMSKTFILHNKNFENFSTN